MLKTLEIENWREEERKKQKQDEFVLFVHKRRKSLIVFRVHGVHTIRRDVHVHAFGDPFVLVPHYRDWCIRQSNTAGGIPIAARLRRSV